MSCSKAGKKRHRIALTSPDEDQDSYGEAIPTFSTYATVWAEIRPLSGKELLHAQQINAKTTHKVMIRYNADIAPKHRIVFNGRTLEIESIINPFEKNVELILTCSEVTL